MSTTIPRPETGEPVEVGYAKVVAKNASYFL